MFPCPATTVAMHLFTSPMHTLKCLLLNSSEQQGKREEEGVTYRHLKMAIAQFPLSM